MALLEDPNTCAICEKPVSGCVHGVPIYFCRADYTEWEADILADKPWIHELARMERIRRRRRNRLLAHGELPVFVNTYDIALLRDEG